LIPDPEGKLVITLPVRAAVMTEAAVVAEPAAIREIPAPRDSDADVLLVRMLFEMSDCSGAAIISDVDP